MCLVMITYIFYMNETFYINGWNQLIANRELVYREYYSIISIQWEITQNRNFVNN